ncbi:MAG: hypothetical protein WCX83_00180 [Candidatus Cloacimonas sp.]
MGTIISRFTEKSTEKSSDKTTCISITAKTYKCIDISAFVPTCITITSNVPTSELYQEQYDRDDVEITDAPILEIILINNEAPVLNVNLDEEGTIYVTDFDVVYIKIINYDINVEYVNAFSNQDGNDAVIWLDEVEERFIWALDDWAFDGVQMWFYAQAKASDKLISPQANVTVMQMEQTDQPNLSSWVSQDGNTILNITILDYDATYIYSEPIVTGGTAVRTDNIIAWTLPVGPTEYHEISITATAPLMYESLPDVSGGIVNGTFYVTDMSGIGPIANTPANFPEFWVTDGLGNVDYVLYPEIPITLVTAAELYNSSFIKYFYIDRTIKFYSMQEILAHILEGTNHQTWVNGVSVPPTYEQLETLPIANGTAFGGWKSNDYAIECLSSYEFYIEFANKVTGGDPIKFPRYG